MQSQLDYGVRLPKLVVMAKKKDTVNLVSWNVNGIRACAKKGFRSVYESLDADVFALQETKAEREQVEPESILPDAETPQVWSSAQKKGYSGTALFARDDWDMVDSIGLPDYDNEGRGNVLYHPNFTLVNLYYPNGAASDERHWFKMGFLDKILTYFKDLEKKHGPLVICGDYNIAHTENDIHDPKSNQKTSGFLPEERAWMDSLTKAGFIDTFRLVHPDRKDAYSWWSYRQASRERNKGWRLDYFFVSEELRKNVVDADILSDIHGSDHCPISLSLKF